MILLTAAAFGFLFGVLSMIILNALNKELHPPKSIITIDGKSVVTERW